MGGAPAARGEIFVAAPSVVLEKGFTWAEQRVRGLRALIRRGVSQSLFEKG